MQTSFDDLGTPLCDVTFVVLDLETTGGSPDACEITEVGALRFRGGECLGTFQTLVNPGVPLPPEIVYLTGITRAMLLPAPRIDAVLPAFLEFIGDAVIVGHNVRFDMGFLQANAARLGYGRLTNKVVDTHALAKRLVRDEVPNCRLATLARHFRTAADPCHRALDDARATAEVFHALLERAGRLGVLALDDLLGLPTAARHPQAAKLRWVAKLPRSPGVYVFRDREGRALYVGKAVDLRSRVRSYFSTDDRRKIGPLLREADRVDHIETAHELEASVLEVRMIQALAPRYNREAKTWTRYAYVKLTLDERFPRLSVVRAVKGGDRAVYLGPVPSGSVAKLVVEAIESVVPLRRCTRRVGAKAVVAAPCTPAQLGVAACPCSGAVGEAEYADIVARAVNALTVDSGALLGPLRARMAALAAANRFEEAASVRDRAAALARTLQRQRRLEALRAAGRLVVEVDGEGGAVVEHGRLVLAWSATGGSALADPLPAPEPVGPIPRDLVDELSRVAAWLDARGGRVRIVECSNGLAWPSPRLPRFEPVRRPDRGVRAVA